MIPEIGGDLIQWLRGFYYTAQMGSMSAAASKMGRNQPALSQQIKNLEETFEVTLFSHEKGRRELTPEGEKLLVKAVAIFEIIKGIKGEFQQAHEPLQGEIRIAATHAVLLYFLPEFIAGFSARNPKADLHLEGGDIELILRNIQTAQADIGIACLDDIPPNLEYQPLFSTRLIFIAPQHGPLTIQSPPTLEQIADLPFISFPASSTIAAHLKQRFAIEGLRLNIVQELNNFELVKRYVNLGLGVSILDEFAIDKNDVANLTMHILEDFFPERFYGLISRKKMYQSPVLKAFVKELKGLVPNSRPT